jgi:hypothetical protein
MAVHTRNHTWDVVDRPNNRQIVDSKWVFKIQCLADESVNKFRLSIVSQGFPQIYRQDYNKYMPW